MPGWRLGWQMRCAQRRGRDEAECKGGDKDRRSSKADAKSAAQWQGPWRLGNGEGPKIAH